MSMDEASVSDVLLDDNYKSKQLRETDVSKLPTSLSIKSQMQEINLATDFTIQEKDIEQISVQEELVLTKESTTSQNPTTQSLDNILLIQSRLDEMKKSLFQVISSIENNTSLLSRWSSSFGNFSIFQKVSTGAVIPTLFIVGGLAASAPIAIIVGGGGSALLYSGAALLLEDHHNQTKGHADELRNGITGLIDLFGHILFSLEQLRHDLTEQVSLLTSENEKLCQNVEELNSLKNALVVEVESITQEISRLEKSNQVHEQETDKLKIAVKNLEDVESKLNKKLEKSERTVTRLESLFSKMNNFDMEQQEDREQFLNCFEDVKKSVIQIESVTSGMSKLQEELAISNGKLEVLGEKYEDLNRIFSDNNAEHAKQIADFKRVMSHPKVQEILSALPEDTASAQVMGQFGLMSSCSQESSDANNEASSSNHEVPLAL